MNINKIIASYFILASVLTLSSMCANAQVPNSNSDFVSLEVSNALASSENLRNIKKNSVVKIGYRQVVPISYSVNDKPMGYAIDICNAIVKNMASLLDMKSLNIQYIPVDVDQRMSYLDNNKIDFECGTTTNTSVRRESKSFSIPYFITGAKILALKKNQKSYKDINDFAGKKMAAVSGTTSQSTLLRLNQQRRLGIKIVLFDKYDDAVNSVVNSDTEGLLLDEIILEDYRNKQKNPDDLMAAGSYVAVEPLAIMMRKDKVLQEFVNDQFVSLVRSGMVEKFYEKWFLSPVEPNRVNYNIKMSAQLTEIMRFPNDIVGN